MNIKKVSFLLFFWVITIYGNGQSHLIDSLNNIYKAAKNDTMRVKALLDMADALYAEQPDSAKHCWGISTEIIEKALKHDSLYPVSPFFTTRLIHLEASSVAGLGYALFITNDPVNGLILEKKSLPLFKIANNKPLLAQSFNNVGYMYTEKGDLYTALRYYDTSLILRRELKDTDGISTAINNLGFAYQQLGDTQKAMQYFREALQLRTKIHDFLGMSTTLNNIATLKSSSGRYDDAIKYYMQSLECAKKVNSKAKFALLSDNIASCLEKKGLPDSALIYANYSLKTYAELNDMEGTAYAMYYIGVVYLDKNKLDSAKKYLTRSFEIANRLDNKVLISRVAYYLWKQYKKEGDYKQALDMYVTYKETSDTINNKKAEKEAIRMQLNYDFQKRELQEQEKQKQAELAHREELKRQHVIIGAITMGALSLLCFIVILASRFRIIRNQKTVIERQKIVVEEKNKDLTDSIEYASRIQRTILPEEDHVKNLFPRSFVLWKPKDIVSGDFYWISNAKGLRYVLAADCTGHGVPGALMSMVGAELFNEAVNIKGMTEPVEILTEVRKGIISSLRQKGTLGEQKDGMDASLCVFGKPAKDGTVTLQFAGANNPIWYISSTNSLKEVPADKHPIGIHGEDLLPFTQQTITLAKGDTIYLFTDGYADQFGGPKGKKFKYKQLAEKLVSLSVLDMDKQKAMLEETLLSWKGNLEQVDDILVIGIRV